MFHLFPDQKAKKLKRSPEDLAIDRISDLPEAIRLYILSFLPLKYAIRTGALSSQWRNLWTQRWLHNSSIHITAALSGGATSEDPPGTTADPAAMVSKLEESLLTLNGRRIDSLILSFRPKPCVLPKLTRLLTDAAACGVEELVLDFSDPDQIHRGGGGRRRRRGRREPLYYLAPLGKFRSLVRLHVIGFHLTTHAHEFKPLRCLESLTLESVHITDAALKRMTGNLPNLRRLNLIRCPDLKFITMPGSALCLEVLVMIACPKAVDLIIDSPNLRSFRFCGQFIAHICFRGVWAPLEDIYFSSGGPNPGLPHSNWVKELGSVTDHVKALTLCSLSLQYMGVSEENDLKDFRNMRNLLELQLLMMTMSHSNLSDIFRFFRLCRCPRLEKIFIELPTLVRDSFMTKFLEIIEDGPPDIFFEHLKIVRVNNFKAHHYEVALLSFFLEKAINLDSMVIIMPRDPAKEEFSDDKTNSYLHYLQFHQMQFALMPRASKKAEIIFCEQDDKFERRTHAEIFCKF